MYKRQSFSYVDETVSEEADDAGANAQPEMPMDTDSASAASLFKCLI